MEPALLDRLRAFCFPNGTDAARSIHGVRLVERGEMRSAPGASWIPFTAEEVIESRRSWFRWDARYTGGRMGWIGVTDAYEEGHGRLTVRLGGVIPVRKIVGPDADQGELQRYLSSVVLCPPMLVNHPSLEWTATGPLTLRVRDCEDPTGATIDLDLNEDGCPVATRTERPMVVGKQAILTPWSARGSEFKNYESFRAATRLEVWWHPPEGPFAYYRSAVTSLTMLPV